MDKEQKQTHPEVGEDATQYGEFVSSYFAWVPLPKQKEKAEEMSKMTQESTSKTPKRTVPTGATGGSAPKRTVPTGGEEEEKR